MIEFGLVLFYIVYFVLLIKFIKHFGEYNYYFNKESKVDRKMYNILILERFIVGLSIVITY